MISNAATGRGTTWTLARPVLPSLVAVTRAFPGASAVITPAAVTDATAGASLTKVTGRLVRTLPSLSVICVSNVSTEPTVSVETLGVSETAPAARARTMTVAVPTRPSLEAEIVADPGCKAMTLPVAVTATAVTLLELQTTTRPSNTPPAASRSVATNWRSVPTVNVSRPGVSETD